MLAYLEQLGIVSRLGANRISEWATILRDYFVWQALGQLVAISTGLLLVNFMPVHEYALYTLLASGMTFLIFFCDLGMTGSLLYFRREANVRGISYETYVLAAQQMRRWLFGLSAPLFLAVLLYLGKQAGFRFTVTLWGALIVLLAVWFQITGSIRLVVLRTEGRYRQSYYAEFLGSVGRLIAAGGMVASSMLYGLLGIVTNALGSFLTASTANRYDKDGLTAEAGHQTASSAARREMFRYLLPTVPSAVYFSFQGPLVVWLSATFAGTQSVAEVGALGRLGVILGLFSGLTSMVLIPRLAAVVDEGLYRRRYVQYGLAFLLGTMGMFAAAAEFPGLFLALLGSNYAGLDRELLLVVGTTGLGLLGGYAVAINQARGWIRWQPMALVIVVAAQAGFVATLPLSTTMGVLWFGFASAAIGFVCQMCINTIGLYRPAWVSSGGVLGRKAEEVPTCQAGRQV
jgi:O-antigen/teichoic acid export membrane protein